MRRLSVQLVTLIVASIVGAAYVATAVSAAILTSPNYMINGNLGGSFGGSISSTSYRMTSIGGEAVIGQGQSASYIMDQQASSGSTMQLSVQPSGLVAYYPLDENTGTTAADASRYQNNGTLNSPASWNASGKIGSAVNMNGTTDSAGTGAVLVPNNANLPTGSAMTVELWANQSQWVANQAFASQWNYSTSGSWAVQTGASNNLRVYIAGSQTDTGTNYVDTTASTWNSFNTWRHIVMTFDGTQAAASRVKVYIDGVQAGTTVTGAIPASLQTSTGAFSIGSFPGLGRALTGSVDQVKLFNRVLNSGEVAAEYAGQSAGASTGLTLGTIVSGSTSSSVDTIVRTNVSSYTVAVNQNHDLQSGANTIPAIGGTISSPVAWVEGTTQGLGFTVTAAPTLDGKWGTGSKYAAIPGSSTTFYSGAGHSSSVVDVISFQLRAGTASTQAAGTYSNLVTYTGTTIP